MTAEQAGVRWPGGGCRTMEEGLYYRWGRGWVPEIMAVSEASRPQRGRLISEHSLQKRESLRPQDTCSPTVHQVVGLRT